MLKTILTSLIFIQPAISQIEINGSVDFAIGYGGENSAFIVNGVNNEFRKPHLAIHEFNLFLFAPIDEEFFFNGRLQWDTWGTGQLNPLKITLAMLTWEPQGGRVSATIGRFVSPFGLYPRRQLNSESSFINAPLIYGYFVNISDTRGFWPVAGSSGIYGNADVGLTSVYFGGYTSGVKFNWIIAEETVDLSLAVTNAAPASQQNFTNLQNIAVIARFGLQPIIFWQQGLSFSHGSFIKQDNVNNNFDRLERFRQTIFGTDIVLAYSYFEISGEVIYSIWKVPGRDSAGFKTRQDGELVEFDLTNYGGYVDLKYEPPFLTGTYLALRYEKMIFDEYDHPNSTSMIQLNPWDNNLYTYSAALGLKLSHSVLFKTVYSDLKYDDSALDGEFWSIRGILTVSM